MAQPADHILMDRIMWRQFGKPVGLTARLNAYPNIVKVMNWSLFFFFPEHHNLPWAPSCIAAPHPHGLDCLALAHPGCSCRVHPAVGTRPSWLRTLGQRRA